MKHDKVMDLLYRVFLLGRNLFWLALTNRGQYSNAKRQYLMLKANIYQCLISDMNKGS